MPKILYISHFHEPGTGWQTAAINYVRAMTSVGLDVVCRSVKLGNNTTPPSDIQILLQKDKRDCDICIQHLLPHFIDYNGNYKNIAIGIIDSKNIHNTYWSSKLNLMDEVWVPYSDGLDEDAITVTKRLVPHAFNLSEYQVNHTIELPLGFKFYYIGELIQRKNLSALIRAFHLTFHPNENVQLILKLNKSGTDSNGVIKLVRDKVNAIKHGMKLYPIERYKSEIVISDFLSREDLLALHNSCDCFVNTSCGEAFCQPAFEAMCLGKTVISNNCGGPKDFLKDYEYGHLVKNRLEPCFGAIETFYDVQTSKEVWWEIDVLELSETMRKVFETPVLQPKAKASGFLNAKKYSYENIGNLIKSYL